VIVLTFIASLKVAEGIVLIGADVAFTAGKTEMTEGGVTSATAAVVKLQEKSEAIELPATSFAAVVIVPVYNVLAVKAVAGVNVTTAPLLVIVPGIIVVPFLIVNDDWVIVPVFNGSLKVTEATEFVGTSVELFPGVADMTVGAIRSPVGNGSSFISFLVQLPIKIAKNKSTAENLPVSILHLEVFSLIGSFFKLPDTNRNFGLFV
jgi:hypothetical protein